MKVIGTAAGEVVLEAEAEYCFDEPSIIKLAEELLQDAAVKGALTLNTLVSHARAAMRNAGKALVVEYIGDYVLTPSH